MQLRKSLHQREPDSESPFGASDRTIALCKEIEQPRKQIGGDADSRIPNPDDNLFILARGLEPNLAAGIGEFRGVREQVDDYLLEAGRIGSDEQVFPRI